jgi:hypothetical protein
LIDIGRNSLLGNRKQIAKFLMRTFTYRSTFLYGPTIKSETFLYQRRLLYQPLFFGCVSKDPCY